MMKAITIALSGLHAAAKKTEASASNIANLTTAGALDEANGPPPYTALTTVQSAQTASDGNGIGVSSKIVAKDPGFVTAFAPDSPFADQSGQVGVPNVNLTEEAVNMKIAETTYRANLATLKTAGDMSDELFRIFDKKI